MHEFTIGPLGEWNGTAKVIVKTGSIFGESADVICLTVSSTLEHSPSIWKSLTTQAGPREYKKAFKTAKEGSQYLGHGDILVVDTSKTKLSAKFVFLVVYPDIHHLDKAYRAIFREAAARKCTSVVIPGLGCGLFFFCLFSCRIVYSYFLDFWKGCASNQTYVLNSSLVLIVSGSLSFIFFSHT
ncbi:unnamed protein product [Haemonchus placei]|uniref:Macro domain-containing protein n=1 Tax=Haemonchus placei TaxID=6290 RepID=A0A0N4X8D2_HAEPC|nr:unnamed protein product [Haemonchus placei]